MPKEISNRVMESKGWRIQEHVADGDSDKLKKAKEEVSDRSRYRGYRIIPTEKIFFEELQMTDFRVTKGHIVYVKPTEQYLRELRETETIHLVYIPVRDTQFGESTLVIKEYHN